MSSSRLLTRFRPDETLYSAVARIGRYLGSPQPGVLSRALFREPLPVIDADLPVGLRTIVGSGVFGPADLSDALHGWTLFPYYAHFAGPARADVAADVMYSSGRWPHEALGSWSASLPPPDRLRFCPACLEEMWIEHADLWWRRAHQLPSVLMCPDHAEPLLNSTVDRDARSSDYVPASPEVCPADAPSLMAGADPRERTDLHILATMSAALLDREADEHPDDRRKGYLRRLGRLGLLNRSGAADLAKVARALDGWWGSTMDFWPALRRDGRCRQRWLSALLWGEHGSPPLHHLLLEGMLAGRVRG